MEYTTFISHSVSPADYSLVTMIANLLWQRGIHTYIPEIYPGTPAMKQIELQIQNSDAVLVLVTRDTARSAWVHQEIGFAKAKAKWILPLIERRVNPEGFLQDLDWVEFDRLHTGPDFEKVADYLKNQANDKAGKKAQSAGLVGLAILGLGLWLLSQGGGEKN